jgi:beta propeller repeat protein
MQLRGSKGLLIITLLGTLLLGACGRDTPAASYQRPPIGQEITVWSRPGNQFMPAVSGDVVVWVSGTTSANLFSVDLGKGKTTRDYVTPNRIMAPAISGRWVVWGELTAQHGWDVMALDRRELTMPYACADDGTQKWPAISESLVVWQDRRSGNWDIWGSRLPDGDPFPICRDPGDQTEPAVSGNRVVWMDRGSNHSSDIRGIDLETMTPFTVTAARDRQAGPAISGTIVVWEDFRRGQWDIYGTDLAQGKEFAVCTDPGEQVASAVSGNLVVWLSARSEEHASVESKNLKTGALLRVSSPGSDAIWCDVSGPLVVWMDRRSGRWQVEAKYLPR